MKGKLIVIDGLDGCGKATQVNIIYNKLIELGHKVRKISFPDYESLSSGPVRMYLHGEVVSNAESLNPYLSSLFYSVDRGIQYYKDFKKDYESGYIILADRYISANIIYQGSKCKNTEDKKELFKWIYNTEINKIGLPKEDLVLALTLPIEVSQKLMSQRYNGNESSKDIHENNIKFLSSCRDNLDIACEYLPTIGYNWVRVDCSSPEGWIKSKEDITETLMTKINQILY
jgi:dTMP kinase